MKRLTLLTLLFACYTASSIAQQNVNITVNPETKPKETKVRSGIVTLYGYLKVITNELGYFETEPTAAIKRINQDEQYGYNTWRLPSNDELEMLRANGYAKNDVAYMTYSNRSYGNVILVTDKDKASVIREREAALRAEQERKAQAEKQARLYEEQSKRNQFIDSLRHLNGWCDLGLPSGTLWNYQGKGDMYRNFAMLYYEDELPTESQWKELIENCLIKKINDRGDYLVTGKNGKSILIHKWSDFYLPEPLGEFNEMSLYSFNENEGYKFQRESEYIGEVLTVKDSFLPEKKQMDRYVDLGLPSGTKWAYRDFPDFGDTKYSWEYSWDDVKRMVTLTSIPRKSQWKELQKLCRWEKREYGYKIIGPNGNWIYLFSDRYCCREDKYGSKNIYSVEILSKKRIQILYGDVFTRINNRENRVRLISK